MEGGLLMTFKGYCHPDMGHSVNEFYNGRVLFIKRKHQPALWSGRFGLTELLLCSFINGCFLFGSVPVPEEPLISSERRPLIGGQGKADGCHE